MWRLPCDIAVHVHVAFVGFLQRQDTQGRHERKRLHSLGVDRSRQATAVLRCACCPRWLEHLQSLRRVQQLPMTAGGTQGRTSS